MKPRAWRITIGAAVLAVVLVAVLAVANWGTVRDHVEAWHFQATREMATIPHPSGCPVILASGDRKVLFRSMRWFNQYDLTDDFVLIVLRNYGWRVLEQRFPRRAFVLIRAPRTEEDEVMDRLLDDLEWTESIGTERP